MRKPSRKWGLTSSNLRRSFRHHSNVSLRIQARLQEGITPITPTQSYSMNGFGFLGFVQVEFKKMVPFAPILLAGTGSSWRSGKSWFVMEGLSSFKCPGWSSSRDLPTRKQGCRFCPLYIFGNKPPQMLPKDLNIGYQGLANWFLEKNGFLGYSSATLFFPPVQKRGKLWYIGKWP